MVTTPGVRVRRPLRRMGERPPLPAFAQRGARGGRRWPASVAWVRRTRKRRQGPGLAMRAKGARRGRGAQKRRRSLSRRAPRLRFGRQRRRNLGVAASAAHQRVDGAGDRAGVRGLGALALGQEESSAGLARASAVGEAPKGPGQTGPCRRADVTSLFRRRTATGQRVGPGRSPRGGARDSAGR